MPIGRVDMQVMIHRTAELNRATNNDGSRAEGQNSQFAQSFQKVVEQEGKQVVNTNQAEKANVDKDGRGKGGRPKQGRKDEEEKKKEEEAKKRKGGMLDIRI